MPKVYVVIETERVDYMGENKTIVAVFQNEDMAKKCAYEDNKATHHRYYDYEEHELFP